MNEHYRASKYIDFTTGQVLLDPEMFIEQTPKPMGLDQKIDFFECRVDVWQLGVAAAMLRQIESAEKNSVWAQADHALIAVTTSYFEMIGKILNPNSATRHTSGDDFDAGFADVFTNFDQKYGKIGIEQFRNLMRNGMYHLGYPKKNLLVHSTTGHWDNVDLQVVVDERGGDTFLGVASMVNPRSVTRTVVNHFGWFMDRLRKGESLRKKFEQFYDEFHEAF